LSREFTDKLDRMMMLAIIFGTVFTFTGLFLSYYLDVPSGATIILTMAAGYMLHFPFKGKNKKTA
jgi:zinc transport system permease protein